MPPGTPAAPPRPPAPTGAPSAPPGARAGRAPTRRHLQGAAAVSSTRGSLKQHTGCMRGTHAGAACLHARAWPHASVPLHACASPSPERGGAFLASTGRALRARNRRCTSATSSPNAATRPARLSASCCAMPSRSSRPSKPSSSLNDDESVAQSSNACAQTGAVMAWRAGEGGRAGGSWAAPTASTDSCAGSPAAATNHAGSNACMHPAGRARRTQHGAHLHDERAQAQVQLAHGACEQAVVGVVAGCRQVGHVVRHLPRQGAGDGEARAAARPAAGPCRPMHAHARSGASPAPA